jgi:HAD superfamily hydrolase (TIGR01509 family)
VSRRFRQIEAVLFDMDGTLVDSEILTERAVAALVRERGLPARPLGSRIEGVTWRRVEAVLHERYPELAPEKDTPLTARRSFAPGRLAVELQRRFQALLRDELPPLIAGAREAVRRACEALPTALVSSSNRESVELLMGQHQLLARFRLTVCAEDCSRPKPDPQCYLLAAERLGCAAERCLVFEDSHAGLRAARAAGMATIAITRGRQGETLRSVRALSDESVDDFTELAPGFFAAITGEQ